MNCKLIFVFLSVLPILAISGCTGGNNIASGPGLVIEAFEPDFSQVYVGETVQLRVLIRNKGTVDATDIYAQISGADWISTADTGTDCSEKQLLPAAPDKGIEGEAKTCSWNVGTNKINLPEGVSMTYHPILNVYYKYSANTVKSVTIGSSNELRRIQDTGGILPSETIASTSGPVSIDVVLKGPLRFSSSAGFAASDVQFPVEIKVTNSGGGVVCKDICIQSTSGSGTENWNQLTLTIKTDNYLQLVCGDNTAGSGTGITQDITLWRGQSNVIGCKATVKGDTSTIAQSIITISANYYYRIDASTSLVVTGTSKSGGQL